MKVLFDAFGHKPETVKKEHAGRVGPVIACSFLRYIELLQNRGEVPLRNSIILIVDDEEGKRLRDSVIGYGVVSAGNTLTRYFLSLFFPKVHGKLPFRTIRNLQNSIILVVNRLNRNDMYPDRLHLNHLQEV
ncbi:hypothetical protein AMQ83_30955 [Paenibacillus riograndensis]|nr:hypothetical protein AMQ83_30955 [Paenibacillus riograndensis]